GMTNAEFAIPVSAYTAPHILAISFSSPEVEQHGAFTLSPGDAHIDLDQLGQTQVLAGKKGPVLTFTGTGKQTTNADRAHMSATIVYQVWLDLVKSPPS